MHNFNYWLQDRDVKYFKEFYLLKGFVFNEQGEPKDVSEPKLDDDGRFWLVPRPGAVPINNDGTFDDKDLIRIKANSPNAGALVRQHQDRWKEFNTRQAAQKAKSSPQNTDPSFASTSPRRLMPRDTGHDVSVERQEAQLERIRYAQMLGLDVEQARKGNFDDAINNAIAKDAIENGKPSFKKLSGFTINTFDYKRILVNTHGDPLTWSKVIKNIWNPSVEEIHAIRAGKYAIKSNSTETELPPTAIKQTYAEPTEAEVAEYKKIQDELKALNNRFKQIRDHLDSNSDTIDDMQLATYQKEARDILSKIAPLRQKLNVLNQKKPAAAPPAGASTPNLAMPPAGASTPNLAMPPATNPEEAKKISLDLREKDLLSQYEKLTVEEDAQEKAKTNPEVLARIKKELEDITTKINAVREERAAMKR
jgi:hypothetical protein